MPKYKIKKCSVVLCGFVLSLVSYSVRGSDAFVLDELTKHQANIDAWQNDAFIVGVIVICIAVLGAVISIVQASKFNAVKLISMILGVAVVGVVAIKEQFYAESRSELNNKVVMANKIITNVKQLMSTQPAELKNTEFYNNLFIKLNQIDDLKQIIVSSTINLDYFSVMGVANAASGKPDWLLNINTSKEDNNSYYFVGRGEDKNVITAESAAINNSLQKAVSHFVDSTASSGQLNIDKLGASKLLKNVLKKMDEYVTKENNQHQYFVLYRLNKNTHETMKKLLSSMNARHTEN